MRGSISPTLAARPEITLAYVSGRDRKLVMQAITNFCLPIPDFVVADVGTTIYHVGLQRQDWQRQTAWEQEIAQDWAGRSHADLKKLLQDLPDLRLQEPAKQNNYKLSYYVPLHERLPCTVGGDPSPAGSAGREGQPDLEQ